MEDDDPGHLPAASRQDRVEELSDDQRADQRRQRRASVRVEEELPTPSADHHADREEHERRHEPDEVAVAEGLPEELDVDVANCEVREERRRRDADEQEQRAMCSTHRRSLRASPEVASGSLSRRCPRSIPPRSVASSSSRLTAPASAISARRCRSSRSSSRCSASSAASRTNPIATASSCPKGTPPLRFTPRST